MPPSTSHLVLQLYVAGRAPNSVQALANLKDIRGQFPDVRFELDVIDTLEDPLRALEDGIVVTPTLVRLSPGPVIRIIGNLSRQTEVLSALDLSDTHGHPPS